MADWGWSGGGGGGGGGSGGGGGGNSGWGGGWGDNNSNSNKNSGGNKGGNNDSGWGGGWGNTGGNSGGNSGGGGGWGGGWGSNNSSAPPGWGNSGTGTNFNFGSVELNQKKRFADLDNDTKNALVQLERRFLFEKGIVEGNKKHLGEPLPAVARDLKAIEGKLDHWMEHLERQYEQVQEFRATVNKELRNAETAYFLLKKLVSNTTYEGAGEELPSEYFWDLCNSFEKRMQECRQRIEELEVYLTSARNPRHFTPKMIQDIVDSQHEFFIYVTSSLASIHEAVDVLREDFVALKKRYDRNYRQNPFEEAEKFRAEKGLRKVADQKLKKKQAALVNGVTAWGGAGGSGGGSGGNDSGKGGNNNNNNNSGGGGGWGDGWGTGGGGGSGGGSGGGNSGWGSGGGGSGGGSGGGGWGFDSGGGGGGGGGDKGKDNKSGGGGGGGGGDSGWGGGWGSGGGGGGGGSNNNNGGGFSFDGGGGGGGGGGGDFSFGGGNGGGGGNKGSGFSASGYQDLKN